MSTNRSRVRKRTNKIERKSFPVPGVFRDTWWGKGKTRAILKHELRREIQEMSQ